MGTPIKSNMLTADQIEALRRSVKQWQEIAQREFGRAPTPAEIEAGRRSDEWWEKRLREMREQEKQRG